MAKQRSVCIIALTWNNKKLISQCLKSIYKNTDYQNYKIIVVENGSTEDCVEFTRKHFPKADVLHITPNRGFSGGNNVGVKYALEKYNPDYVILISNDIEIVQKDWLNKMVDLCENNKSIGVQSCKLLYPDGTIQHAGIDVYRIVPLPEGNGEDDRGQYDYVKPLNSVIGALFLISRKAIKDVGLLDEIYRPAMHEDLDYCIRARKKDFVVVYNGLVKAIHHEGVTLNKSNLDDKFFVSQRNLLLLTLRHFPLSYTLLRLLEGMIFALVWKKPRQRLSIRSIIPNKKFLLRLYLVFKGFKWAILHKDLKPIY